MGIIAKYKFNQNTYANFIPEFNSEFTDYTITDEIDTDGYTIRTIGNDSGNLPTLIRFGTNGGVASDREKSLLEVYECNTENVTDMSHMFRNCTSLTSLDLSNFNTQNVTNMSYMFYYCPSLTSLDFSNFNTQKVTNMSFMFYNCNGLTSLDLSSFNTQNVEFMNGMFYYCPSLTSLNLSNFNTQKVTNMSNMFRECPVTSLDLSSFNTESVTNMSNMFYECSVTSLDLSSFNTESVTNMSNMFYECSNLTSLNISNFNTQNVTDMSSMFYECSNLTSLDLSNFNTENVTTMENMFNGCSSLTSLDISNFNIENITNTNTMFYKCSKLIDVGMIYCNSSTINRINKIVNLLTTNTTIWYSEDEVNIEELDVLENITYKPYKENRISYEGITLRSLPNGVKDEINVLTGEYIQRVEEIIFDGSEDESWHKMNEEYNGITTAFYHKLPTYENRGNVGVCSMTHDFHELNSLSEVDVEGYGTNMWGNCYIRLFNKTASDVTMLREFLLQNPITLQYELAEPIIHQLDPQSLTPYQDGYISMEAEVNYPSFIYSLPSTNTFYIPKIKNMTQYTLKYPIGSGTVTIGNIQYNVTSDSMLFTTPIEITGDKNSFVFETDDNPTEVMILEGNYSDREVKYFTGINSVINPTIRVTNSLTGGSVEYKGNSNIALYSLPNKMSDKLDVLTGYLMRVTGIREYQDGDYELDNVFTDGVNTVYKLDSPLLYKNINFPIPTLNGYGTIELDSDEAIPQLNYRVLSNNYYPIELLEPNTTYTMIGEAQANTTFTLGGTYVGNYSGGKLVVNLGTITEKSLKFSNDIGLKNFMLVKDDATNSTLPFYTGIKSVENITFNIKGFDGQENSLVLGDSIVLRKCGNVYDSIDLINGTMTKQLNEIVLTGSEIWSVETSKSLDSNYQLFSLATTSAKDSKNATIYCDKLPHNYLATSLNNQECIYFENNKLYLCIKKLTIGGDNVNALKTWLTKNNMTIIYPLINSVKLDLDVIWEVTPPISYETQTEFDSSVALGSLKPMLAVTVATTTLEEIVSELNAKNRQLEAESLVTMLAVTEVYEMIYGGATTMSLKDSVESKPRVMSINETEEEIEQTAMGKIYVKLIKAGMKTIEQVPYFLQEEVIYYLNKE